MNRTADLPSDSALLSMSTFPNGCDFTLRFYDDRVFLSYGCYGVHVNLVQGARRELMEWLGRNGQEREVTGMSPKTLLALKSRKPCRLCGGFTFWLSASPVDEKAPVFQRGIEVK